MIRPCTRVDEPGWLEMRQALWPEASRAEHLDEMQTFLDQPQRYGQFIGLDGAGRPTGFIEAAVRGDYVNGTETSPVAFVEGLYVKPEYRRQGWAASLMRAIEAWARDMGCQELASDAALDNRPSHAAHLALGFEETERVVYFRKVIGDA
jgi:aminoglycoside 6'-N-acetyltransferase I